MSKKVTSSKEIAQVGTISANQDEQIGKMIADAMDKVGKDGVITVEEGKSLDTTIELVEGMQFDKGYLSPALRHRPGQRWKAVLDDATSSSTRRRSAAPATSCRSSSKVAEQGKPMLIIAEDIEGEALATLVVNKLRGTLKVCAVKAPGFGDRRKAMLEDIAIVTGGHGDLRRARHQARERRVSKQLGRAKKIRVDKDNTTIIEGAGDRRPSRAASSSSRTRSRHDHATTTARSSRSASPSSPAASRQINVGAATEVAMKEKKARVEDALHAAAPRSKKASSPAAASPSSARARANVKNLKGDNDDQRRGVDIVRRAIEAPIKQIAENAGVDGGVVAQKVVEGNANFGYNALTHEYGDLMKMGVIVPTKVERIALQNAASIACC